MSGIDDDRDLEGLFQSVRREDREGGPSFVGTWEEARRRAAGSSRRLRGLRVVLGAALATAAIVAVVLAVREHQSGGLAFSEEDLRLARELSEWTAPSDGLARLSGVRVSDDIPSLEFESVPLPRWTAPAVRTTGASVASTSRADL